MSSRALYRNALFARVLNARVLLGVVGVVLFVLMLESISAFELVSPRDLPPPHTIFRALAREFNTAQPWILIYQTLWQALIGLLIASVIAIPCGFILGSSEFIWRSLRPSIEFLRAVPAIGLIPVVVLAFGNAPISSILLASYAAVWPLLIQAMYGIREIEPVARDTARTFKLTTFEKIAFLILPSAAPFLATGFRFASVVCLLVAVSVEVVIGAPGLGRGIMLAHHEAAVDVMYALIVVTGLIGICINEITAKIESSVLVWHPASRPGDVQ